MFFLPGNLTRKKLYAILNESKGLPHKLQHMTETLSSTPPQSKAPPQTAQQIIDKILSTRKLTTSSREALEKTIKEHADAINTINQETRNALTKFLENNSKYGNVSAKFKEFSIMMVPKLKESKPVSATQKASNWVEDTKTAVPDIEETSDVVWSEKTSTDTSSPIAEAPVSEAETKTINQPIATTTEIAKPEVQTPIETAEVKVNRIREALGKTTLQLGSRAINLSVNDISIEPTENENFVLKYGKLDMVTKTPILIDKNGHIITEEIQIKKSITARIVLSDVPDGAYKLSHQGNTINISKT